MPLATLDHPVWRAIAPELRPEEFRYPTIMDVDALYRLSRIRRAAGVPFRIVSDYRPPDRNEAVGGAKGSAHMQKPCTAVDLHVKNNYERFKIIEAAILEGVRRFGVYPAKEDNSGSIHLDFSKTHPQPRTWTRY